MSNTNWYAVISSIPIWISSLSPLTSIRSATSSALSTWNAGLGAHPAGTRGIDQFIGVSDMIGRGHGPRLIRQFVDGLLISGTPRVVTDPDPGNGRAVRAYEKAGFEREGLVDTPDGPALLMVRNR
jgi:aminoglycoside 6'-N-acetyltransferase